eukprot:6251327-Prymnesium_polylepis.1
MGSSRSRGFEQLVLVRAIRDGSSRSCALEQVLWRRGNRCFGFEWGGGYGAEPSCCSCASSAARLPPDALSQKTKRCSTLGGL